MAKISRQDIIDALARGLEREPWVLAASLGGSDATGRTDGFSDVDLGVVVEPDRVEDAFERLRAILAELSPIEIAHRLPEPTWHGHSQTFYRLADADPHHMVDVCVMKRGAPGMLLERERHGEAIVLFDREKLLRPVPLDRAAHAETMRRRLATLRETVPMFQPLVERAVARGFGAEAAYFYLNLTLKGLVELLRMHYCPDRFDFGLRYLDRDLPPALRREIEHLAFPADPSELARFRERAAGLFLEELAALDRGEWQLPGA
jgi:predicted nucleotidyltransferase